MAPTLFNINLKEKWKGYPKNFRFSSLAIKQADVEPRRSQLSFFNFSEMLILLVVCMYLWLSKLCFGLNRTLIISMPWAFKPVASSIWLVNEVISDCYGISSRCLALKDRSDIYFNWLVPVKSRYLWQENSSICFESCPLPC